MLEGLLRHCTDAEIEANYTGPASESYMWPSFTAARVGRDKYGGRFDGEVTLADGSGFGDQMVSGGHAVRITSS